MPRFLSVIIRRQPPEKCAVEFFIDGVRVQGDLPLNLVQNYENGELVCLMYISNDEC